MPSLGKVLTHPVFILLGVIASVIAIFSFLTGRQSLFGSPGSTPIPTAPSTVVSSPTQTATAPPTAGSGPASPDVQSLTGDWVNASGTIYRFASPVGSTYLGGVIPSSSCNPPSITVTAQGNGLYAGTTAAHDSPCGPEVGRISISIQVSSDGKTAHFVSAAPGCGNCGPQDWTRQSR
jgi:hypothetical protein